MPSEAFIKAASAANRKPVVCLAIESPDAIKALVTTQNDWEASEPVNLNTSYKPGQIFLVTDDIDLIPGVYSRGFIASDIKITPELSALGGSAESDVLFSGPRITGVTVNCWARHLYSTVVATITLYGSLDGGNYQSISTITFDNPIEFKLENLSLSRGQWDFKIGVNYVVNGVLDENWDLSSSYWVVISSYQIYQETRYLATGLAVTPADKMDFGLIPTVSSRFEADHTINTGCSIDYTAWGRDTDTADWISLGAVSDGSTLAAHRYYKIHADLYSSSDGMLSPTIDELRIVGGDSQYIYISTHKDIPVHGALPYITPGGISSISSKIDLQQQATVGELTATLHWRKALGDLVAGDSLKNKTISCKLGFIGLSEADYEPYFVGSWYDYQSDQTKGTITVKTRNILKRFTRKVPEADYFLDANFKQIPNITYLLQGNIMAVMVDIANQLGIPDRYIDRATFTALGTGSGARTGDDWNVTRHLTEPQDAMEMLNQLAVSAGIFLFEGSDGRLTAQLYDDFAVAAPVEPLDAMHCKFKPVNAGQKDLNTRQAIYYDLISGQSGGSASDYNYCHLQINQQSEIDWNETNTLEWFDMWGLSPVAIQLLAQRRESWFSVPRATVTVDDVPPRLYGIGRGQVVSVDNLQLPCPADQWQGYTSGTRFLVMGKSISDPTRDNLTVSFDLMQLEAPVFTIDPDFPTYSRLDYWPAVTDITLTERLSVMPGGAIITMLDVGFTPHFNYLCGGASIWSKTNSGDWTYQGSVRFGGPVNTRVFSFPVTDGDSVQVAVLTINTRNQTMPIDIAPKAGPVTIAGKSTPPANVTGLSVTVDRTFATLTWNAVSDVDLAGYEIRVGASWSAGMVLHTKFVGNRMIYYPNTVGTYTFRIKAIDTSGNYSAAETTCTKTIATLDILNANEVSEDIHTDFGDITGLPVSAVSVMGADIGGWRPAQFHEAYAILQLDGAAHGSSGYITLETNATNNTDTGNVIAKMPFNSGTVGIFRLSGIPVTGDHVLIVRFSGIINVGYARMGWTALKR